MNYASKLFRGSTDHWQTTKIKQQLYWVLIVAAGLFVAVRGLALIASLVRGEAAAPAAQSSPVDTDQNSAEQEALPNTPNASPAAAAAPAASDETKREETPTAAILTQQVADDSVGQNDEAPQTATNDPTPPATVVVTEREIIGAIFSPVDRTAAAQPPGDRLGTSNEAAAAEPTSSAEQADLARRFFAALAAINGEQDSGAARTPAGSAATSRQTPISDSALPVEAPRDFVVIEEAGQGEAPSSVTTPRAQEALVFLFGGRAAADETPAADRKEINSGTANWLDVLVGRPHEAAEAVVDTSAAANGEAEWPSVAAETAAATQETGQTADTVFPSAETQPAQAELPDAAPDNAAPLGDDSAASREMPAERIGLELVLVNPVDSGGDVRYLLNGYSFAMPPGHSQHLPADRDWRVQFHRGGAFADTELVLRRGSYEFRADERGWDLKGIEGEGAAER